MRSTCALTGRVMDLSLRARATTSSTASAVLVAGEHGQTGEVKVCGEAPAVELSTRNDASPMPWSTSHYIPRGSIRLLKKGIRFKKRRSALKIANKAHRKADPP